MSEILHTIKHRLRIHNSEHALWNLQVIYEPEYNTLEFSGPGGRVNIDVENIEQVITLLERAVAIRDGVVRMPSDAIDQ